MKETQSGGVTIRYEDLGQGGPALLLMPAWCMSHAGFATLPEKLAENRRVLAVDWRGHGASDKPQQDFGWEALVEDALAVAAAAGVETFVPVTLSHAGWAAVEIRRQLGPERVPKIVNLDWIVLPPPDFYMNVVHALGEPDTWEATRDQLFGMWLEGVDNQDVIDFVQNEMGGYDAETWLRSGREIGACYAAGGFPLQALASLNPPAPALHLYSQPADDGYLQGQQAFAQDNPWFHVRRLNAKSHFPTFEAADEIADTIEKFVSDEAKG